MNKELRILMLEDDPADAALEELELRKSGLVFTLKVVDTKEAFLKELDEFVPDIILSDYDLPSFNGLSALRIAKEKFPAAPFIFVAGTIGEEIAVKSIKEGATDYVLKGNLKRLAFSVKRAMEETELIAERKRSEDALKEADRTLRSIVENSSDQIFMLDKSLKYLFVNKSLANTLGKVSEEIIGKSIKEVFSPEIAVQFSNNIHKVFETAKSLFIEEKITVQGQELFVSTSLNPVLDNMGRVRAVTGIVRDITERKQTETETRWKTALLEAQMNATVDGILIVDEKGNKVIQNQRCIDLWKIPQHIVDNHDDKQQVEFVMNRAKDPEKFVEKVVYLYTHPNETSQEDLEFKDGTILDRYSAPVIGKDGTFFGRIWVFRDVTNRVRAEEVLRESEAQLRAILDATPFPIALVNVQGDSMLFWSRSALTLFGHTAPTATEWYQIAYPDPDYRSDVINRWAASLDKARLSGQAVNSGEYRITCRDGSVRICELYATFLAERLIVTFNDITERKKFEDALRISEAELHDSYFTQATINMILRESLENIPLELILQKALNMILSVPWLSFESIGSIHLVEGEPGILSMKAYYNLPKPLITLCAHIPFGNCLCGKAAQTQNIEFAYHADDRHQISYEGMPDHGHYAVPILFRCKTLGLLNIYLQEGHIRDQKEEEFLLAVAGTLAGIIVRKKAEEEQRKLETQLLLAQKMEAVGVLAGGIAHDFNNLLQSIIMGTAIAKTRSHEDNVREILMQVENECLKAEELSNLLITFSKGGTPLAQKSFIADMLKETVLRVLKGSPVDTEIVLPDDLWPVEIDEGQFRIALNQLVMNAKEAMPSGGMLKVQVQNLESIAGENISLSERKYIRVTFTDNGAGISPENLSRIFDPYFTTKQMGSKKGVGLSLAVSQSIVKKHNGIITAESKGGEGATFHMYLPAAQDG